MKLKFIQLDLQWPQGLPVSKLRGWLLDQIGMHGEPLRWAITEISQPDSSDRLRDMKVEAFVILSKAK